MYCPFLRGRQNELLAVRALADSENLEHVMPIIEPVKANRTLVKTLQSIIDSDSKVIMIMNPSVGDYRSELTSDEEIEKEISELLENSDNIITGLRVDYDFSSLIQDVDKTQIAVVNEKRDYVDSYTSVYAEDSPKYTVTTTDFGVSRKSKKPKILLCDHFNLQEKNSDYLNLENESFSEDHLYYKEEGFDGFSDYSIVGDSYKDSGFAPRAVAIHLAYLNDSDGSVWIRHFVSDNNGDINDPAAKYYEAVTKLAQWVNTNSVTMTEGLKQLLAGYENQKYPGLGTIKKLTLMHHIEMMNKFLSEVN